MNFNALSFLSYCVLWFNMAGSYVPHSCSLTLLSQWDRGENWEEEKKESRTHVLRKENLFTETVNEGKGK